MQWSRLRSPCLWFLYGQPQKAGSTSSHPQPSLWTDFLRPPQERPNSLSSVPSLANSPLPQTKILAAGPIQKTNRKVICLGQGKEGKLPSPLGPLTPSVVPQAPAERSVFCVLIFMPPLSGNSTCFSLGTPQLPFSYRDSSTRPGQSASTISRPR